jgi:hypothetical protein
MTATVMGKEQLRVSKKTALVREGPFLVSMVILYVKRAGKVIISFWQNRTNLEYNDWGNTGVSVTTLLLFFK